MLEIKTFKSGLISNTIFAVYKRLEDEVINKKNIVILKNVFEKDLLQQIKLKVFNWGKGASPSNPTNSLKSNWHRIDNNPLQSENMHIFHAYNFVNNRLDCSKDLWEIFLPMKKLQEKLSNTSLSLPQESKELSVRPQVLHYPSGGGFFDWHIHPLLPQKVGLILSLSDKGADFNSGGTAFRVGDKLVNIESNHEIGDIAIFRYDVDHAVTKVDLDKKKIDFNNSKGKWSFILPYY